MSLLCSENASAEDYERLFGQAVILFYDKIEKGEATWVPREVRCGHTVYKRTERLGQGSYGIVFAFETREVDPLIRRFCIKSADTPEEAEAVAALQAVLPDRLGWAVLSSARGVHVAMPLFDGTLADVEPRSLEDVFTIIGNVCDLLCPLWESGFMYMDIKPSNILVSSCGKYARVRLHLGDLGSVRNVRWPGAARYSRTYEAPEHVVGLPEQRDALWSIGITLLMFVRAPEELLEAAKATGKGGGAARAATMKSLLYGLAEEDLGCDVLRAPPCAWLKQAVVIFMGTDSVLPESSSIREAGRQLHELRKDVQRATAKRRAEEAELLAQQPRGGFFSKFRRK